MKEVNISTVTPVYRGAKTLRNLVEEINICREALINSQAPIRIVESIFVDDGSSDGSSEVLTQLRSEYNWIRVIFLSRNFGTHSATNAGVSKTIGDWVVTMDEDLQHHPKYINEMLYHAILNEYDIVYANSSSWVHNSAFRDLSSRMVKKVLSFFSGNKNMIYFNSFRIIRGSIARAASDASIDQTYFDVALSWFTTRIGIIAVPLKDLRYINSGESGFSFFSLLNHAKKLLQSSNVNFTKIGSIVGILAIILGLLSVFVVIVIKLFYPEMVNLAGWASLLIAILLLGGLNALLSVIMLQNISVILMKTHGKPKYFEVDRSSDIHIKLWLNSLKK